MATSIIKASFGTDTIYKWPGTFANTTMTDIVTQIKQRINKSSFACQFDFYSCQGMPTISSGHAIAFYNIYFASSVNVLAIFGSTIEATRIEPN